MVGSSAPKPIHTPVYPITVVFNYCLALSLTMQKQEYDCTHTSHIIIMHLPVQLLSTCPQLPRDATIYKYTRLLIISSDCRGVWCEIHGDQC